METSRWKGPFRKFDSWVCRVAEQLKQQHKRHNKVHTYSVSQTAYCCKAGKKKRLFVASHQDSGLYYKVTYSVRWLSADFSLFLGKVNSDIITCTQREHWKIAFCHTSVPHSIPKAGGKQLRRRPNSGSQSNPSKWTRGHKSHFSKLYQSR